MPDVDLRILRIRAEDGLLLRELRLRSLAESPDAFGQPLAEAEEVPAREWQQLARSSSHGDHRIWLFAARGDDIVGLVQGRRRRPSTLLLHSMWVEPGVRRQGFGAALIEALEAWGRGWGAHETILWVYGGNDRAIRFYRGLGFEVLVGGEDAESGSRFGALAMRHRLDR